MKPLWTLNGLDFSSLFWLFVVLRGKQLLSCDCSRSLRCTRRQSIGYICKADGQKDAHANVVNSFQTLFSKTIIFFSILIFLWQTVPEKQHVKMLYVPS